MADDVAVLSSYSVFSFCSIDKGGGALALYRGCVSFTTGKAPRKKSNLLLLEEPWAGLDGTAKKSIMNRLSETS